MAEVKRYEMTGKAHPFMRKNDLQFRIRYEVIQNGTRRIIAARHAPIITCKKGGVISTTNTVAQRMIAQYFAPAKTLRNGEARPAGLMFADVTATTSEKDVDVDLDPIFEG